MNPLKVDYPCLSAKPRFESQDKYYLDQSMWAFTQNNTKERFI